MRVSLGQSPLEEDDEGEEGPPATGLAVNGQQKSAAPPVNAGISPPTVAPSVRGNGGMPYCSSYEHNVVRSADGKSTIAFDSIKAVKQEEPTVGDITRVQIRCPGMLHYNSIDSCHLCCELNGSHFTTDGQRVVRKFLKSDPVRRIFEYVKSSVPGADKPFEVRSRW